MNIFSKAVQWVNQEINPKRPMLKRIVGVNGHRYVIKDERHYKWLVRNGRIEDQGKLDF